MTAVIRVLYVDDEPDLLDIGKIFLEDSGDLTVTTAVSAPEGIRLLEEKKFDCIVSDYQMPGMDGIQFLAEMRTRFGQIPFILFTGRGREEVVIQALNSGANFYLQKGGDPGAQFAELTHKILTAVEHHRSGEKIQSLNRLYSVLSATNKAIINIRTKDGFFSEICRILVKTGGFRMAWIGLADPGHRIIRPAAYAGHVDGYLDEINISTEDVPHGRGPTGTAYREGKYFFSNDIVSDPRMETWRENALKRGYLANAAFPFALATKNAGVISLYAPVTEFFDEQIIALLEELATDVSFALRTIDELDYRKQAEEALKESEEKFHTLYQNMTEGATLHQLTYDEQGLPVDYVIIEINSAFERLLGISRDMVIGKTSRKAYGVAEPPYLEIYARVALTGEPESFETYFPPLAKHFSISVYCPKKGRFATIFEDITERKRTEEELIRKNEELHASYEEITATEEELLGNLDELTRQEQALRKSEASLRAILDATPFPIALVDLEDNNIEFWSRSALTLFGHTAPTAAEWYQLAYPDPGYRQEVIDRWKPYLEQAKLSGQPVNTGEYRVTCRDGTVRICELYATFLADKLVVTFNDVTERKVALAALTENEERLRTTLEILPVGIFIFSKTGQILAANAMVNRIWGITDGVVPHSSGMEEFVEYKGWWPDTGVALRPGDWAASRVLMKGEAAPVDIVNIRRFDGSFGTINVSAVPIHDAGGEVTGAVAVIQDITERKRADEARRISEGRLHTLVQTIPDLVWLKDKEGVYLSCNTMFARFFGAQEADIVGKTDYDFVDRTLGDLFRENDRKAMQAGKPTSNEEWISFSDDGHRALLETIKTPMFDDKGTLIGVLGIGRDITERKRREDALRKSEERLIMAQDIASTGSWEYNLQTNEIWGSAEGLRVFGFPAMAGDFPIDKIEDCIPERERVHQALVDLIGAGKEYNLEYVINPRDGSAPKMIHSIARLENDAQGDPLRVVGIMQDITDRKRVEEELRESRQILQAILNSITFRVFWKDRNLVYLGCNTVFAKDAGFETTEDIIGKDDYAMAWHEQAELYQSADREVMTSGRPKLLYEEPQTTPSGETIHLLTSKIPLRSAVGNIVGVLGTYLDITELKRIETRLRESEEVFREVFNNASDAIFLHKILPDGLPGVYFNVNDIACTSLGYSREEFYKMSPLDIIAPEYRPNVPEIVKIVQSNEYATFREILQRKDGSTFPVEVSTHSFILRGERVGLSIVRDITKRKQAEEALRTSEQKLNSILNDITDVVWSLSWPDMKVYYLSPSAEKLYGRPVQEFIDKPSLWAEITHPDDRPISEKTLDQLRKEGSALRECRIVRPDGTIVWIHDKSKFIFDEHDTPIRVDGISFDITERKRTEESLRAANKKLNLLSSITRHDINNQITVLMSYLSILQKKQPDATRNEYFPKITIAAQRISSMIQFTKEYESIGITAPVWQDCRIVVDTAAKQITLGPVVVKNDLPTGQEVFADPLIVKVFYNLMDNAVRYGGKITTIRFSAEQAGDDHIIVCEDDGEGVVADDKENIFEQGFGKNTGLGLTLSREILSITGITIRETGEPGKGARFEMKVPKGMWRIEGKST